MNVTVAICTWNRARLLDETLSRFRSVRVPAGLDWELLVVNNRSTDDTDEVLKKYESALPLRRLFEPQQGLSHARNCAIAAAQGELLLWTDDDVLVDADWLGQLVRAANSHPTAAYFGGPIDPWFETDARGGWSGCGRRLPAFMFSKTTARRRGRLARANRRRAPIWPFVRACYGRCRLT